jgi:hypothetical protein
VGCSAPAPQNVNSYSEGQHVYLRGDHFAAGSLTWTITGQPGGASGDAGVVVASGVGEADGLGYFCIDAYTVASDDWGVYQAVVTQGSTSKADNFTVVAGTTDPGTTDPGTTDPGTTDPGTTDPGTTDPGTTDPGTTDPGTTGPGTTGPGTTGPGTTGDTGTDTDTAPLAQSVLGLIQVNPVIELPATDTVGATTGPAAPTILIAGLAAIAGLAVLFAPSRRRKADQLA